VEDASAKAGGATARARRIAAIAGATAGQGVVLWRVSDGATVATLGSASSCSQLLRCEGGLLPKALLAEGVIAWRRGDEAGVSFAGLDPETAPTVTDYVAARQAR